jgi:uncharacterized protein
MPQIQTKRRKKMGEQAMHYYTAFEGNRRIASGGILEVVEKVKEVLDGGSRASCLIFDDATGETAEVDFRGTTSDVINRLKKNVLKTESGPWEVEAQAVGPKGPGRPKLGVVSREVTLLPRHWEWLNSQPGGASVALRKLVEEARKTHRSRDQIRWSRDAAYRFMDALGGNLPGFEEAIRALFAGNREAFNTQVGGWPEDIRDYAKKISDPAFQIQENPAPKKAQSLPCNV